MMFPSFRSLSSPITRILPVGLLLFAGIPVAHGQATTGFEETTAGPFDYDASGNWVGGTINGLWDPSLILTAPQAITFDSDLALATPLSFGYTGNFALTLRGDGTNRTITLGGDISVSPVSNQTVTFGSSTAGQNLNVNLGGDRTFTVAGNKTLTFLNTLSGGDFTLTGGGTMRLAGNGGAAASSDATVALNSTLIFDSSTSGVTGAIRAQSVSLRSGGRLQAVGNAGAHSVDTMSGDLIIDGSATRAPSSANSISNVTIAPSGSRNALLIADSVQRVAGGVVLFRGPNLGSNAIATPTANSGNIQFTESAPTLVGGGGATGSTNISIIPWALGGTTISDAGSTFVTYTTSNGVRPLNIATEFASTFGNATDNVRITAATVLSGDTVANSIITTASTGISGTGTLRVTSGAVFLNGSSSGISSSLDFGNAEAVIGYSRGNTISGAIAGSGGLTVYGLRTDEALQFTGASSTYTGDTNIQGSAEVTSTFLPNANRLGDVYVYGNLRLFQGGYNGSINGLNGNGTVTYGNSGSSSFRVGDNDANGSFSGVLSLNNSIRLVKIGAGIQTLTGTNTLTTSTFLVSGALRLGVNSSTGNIGSLGLTPITGNGGTFHYDGTGSTATNNNTQSLGALTFTSGASTIQTTRGSAASSTLTFASLAARGAGSTGNFIVADGTNGTNNRIVLTGVTADSFLDRGFYFGGSNYAYYDAAGYVRGVNWGVDAGSTTSAGGASLAAATYAQTTGDVTGQTSATFTTLNLVNTANTPQAFTLASGQTVTVNSILRSGDGGSSSTTTISGGTAIRAASGAELIVRTDKGNDSLVISTPIIANGANTLVKDGAGTLTLGATNTYTGQTYVNGGTLSISANANLGQQTSGAQLNLNNATLRATGTFGLFNGTAGTNNRAVKINNVGTFEVTGSNTLTIAGVISDDFTAGSNTAYRKGTLVKSGTGTLILGGASTYSGQTRVNAGTLLVNGSLAAGSQVEVNNSGTLGGSGGTVNGNVDVNNGGTLAPGSSIGTLNTGTVTFESGSTFAVELNTGATASDLLNITGNFNLAATDDSLLSLTLLGTDSVLSPGTVFTLADYSGSWNGGLFELDGSTLFDGEMFVLGLNTFEADYNNGTAFTLTAVPEPASVLLLLTGFASFLCGRRRRRTL